jgi:hypothetical protein
VNSIKLNGHLFLTIEPDNKRLRLIVSDGEVELVCHKTTLPELKRSLQQTDEHLFKGRLQLNKSGDEIVVILKGEAAGRVSSSEFGRFVDQHVAAIS